MLWIHTFSNWDLIFPVLLYRQSFEGILNLVWTIQEWRYEWATTRHHVFVTWAAAWCLCLEPLSRASANSTVTYTLSIGGWNLACSCSSAVTQLVQVTCFSVRALKETKPVLLFRFCGLFVCWGFCVYLVFFFFFLYPSWWLYLRLDVFS